MNLFEIPQLRLSNQQISETKFTSAKDIVSWMGAMQAQDLAMAKWAVGLRVPGSTEISINEAIDKGEILRTHVLRPTWHFVIPDDIGWMLGLTAKRIKSAMSSTDKLRGLDDTIYNKTNAIIEKALSAGHHLTRDELIARIEAENIRTNDNRASHMFVRAELEGIICSGKSKGSKPTFALFSERAPKANTLLRDEALAKLAQMYFRSHAPATLKDFTWWSGLSANDSRNALELIKQGLLSEPIGNETYWFTNDSYGGISTQAVMALPAFDEFLISYKDRTSALPLENMSHAVSNNGIFKPVIIRNGQVIGIWKRTIIKNTVIIETSFFRQMNVPTKKALKKPFYEFGNFLGKEVEIR